jgi:hypothetical protein
MTRYFHGASHEEFSPDDRSATTGRHPPIRSRAWTRRRELEQLGGTVITLQNNSAANAGRAIEVLGSEVLPALRGSRV